MGSGTDMNAGVEADRLAAAAVRRTGDATAVAAALLHDVVETGQIADRDLDAVVSDPRVVELVRCLTRQPGESDRAYLTRCAAEPSALRIKRADLADKLDAPDVHVPHVAAEAIRGRARARLRVLEELALQIAPDPIAAG